MLLSDISVKRPVFAAVISLLLVAFGVISFTQLPLREFPDVDPPVVTVSTDYVGASAAVVETRVTQVIEDRIAGVEGIKSIESSSRDGRSDITIEFKLSRDIDGAANDVRDRVSRVLDNLPEEADPPEVFKVDSNTRPIMWFNLTSPVMDVLQLTDFAERNIVDRLSVVDGVARIIIGGQQRYAIRIFLDRQALAARGLTVADVEGALRAENVELPAGEVESVARDFTVRVEREYRRPEDFATLVIAEGEDGHLIRLGEVARVELAGERERREFRGNGQPMIGLGIVRQSTANTLDVARAVKQAVDRVRLTLPESIEIADSYDSSVFVESAVREVYRTLAIAMGLVVLVLFAFLGNIRTVMVPAVTVPVCLIATFTVMNFLGLSINLLTLLGLVLAIGLVVDDAIVVLENIYRRIEEGERGLLAAYRGARQVGFAVIATTLVLIGVFVPIIFLEGNVGRLFGELAVALSAAVAFSSLVALTLAPMLCSKLLSRRMDRPAMSKWIDRQFVAIRAGYGRSLEFCFNHRGAILAAFLATFVVIAGLMRAVPSELAPQEDRGAFFVTVRGPEGAGFEYMREQMRLIEAQTVHLVESGEARRVLMRTDANRAFGIVILSLWGERDRSAAQIVAELNRRYENVPGVRTFIVQPQGIVSGRSREPVQFVVGGDDYPSLARFRDVIQEAARDNPGLISLDADYRETQPQFRVRVDRNRAADLGVSIATIGRTLETALGGRTVTTFIDRGEEYDVIVRLADADRRQPSDIDNIYVRSGRSGELIPLSNLTTLQEIADASALNRYNRVRALTISANLAPGYSLGDALAFLEGVVASELPEVVNIDYKGESREFKEAGGAIYFTFAIALLVVFLILAAQFESFLHPLVIMLTVPLAVAGGLLGLYLTGSTLNIYSQLGMIMLIGLAAKNGILIVEFANQMRDKGLEIKDALIEAAQVRLRPIIMTSLSTAMGALPLILATGAGSASRLTIGVVVFSGVLVATFFTLFVVPVFYMTLARYTRPVGFVAARIRRFEEEEHPSARDDHIPADRTPAE